MPEEMSSLNLIRSTLRSLLIMASCSVGNVILLLFINTFAHIFSDFEGVSPVVPLGFWFFTESLPPYIWVFLLPIPALWFYPSGASMRQRYLAIFVYNVQVSIVLSVIYAFYMYVARQLYS